MITQNSQLWLLSRVQLHRAWDEWFDAEHMSAAMVSLVVLVMQRLHVNALARFARGFAFDRD
jgi:hypothetical protein